MYVYVCMYVCLCVCNVHVSFHTNSHPLPLTHTLHNPYIHNAKTHLTIIRFSFFLLQTSFKEFIELCRTLQFPFALDEVSGDDFSISLCTYINIHVSLPLPLPLSSLFSLLPFVASSWCLWFVFLFFFFFLFFLDSRFLPSTQGWHTSQPRPACKFITKTFALVF